MRFTLGIPNGDDIDNVSLSDATAGDIKEASSLIADNFDYREEEDALDTLAEFADIKGWEADPEVRRYSNSGDPYAVISASMAQQMSSDDAKSKLNELAADL